MQILAVKLSILTICGDCAILIELKRAAAKCTFVKICLKFSADKFSVVILSFVMYNRIYNITYTNS